MSCNMRYSMATSLNSFASLDDVLKIETRGKEDTKSRLVDVFLLLCAWRLTTSPPIPSCLLLSSQLRPRFRVRRKKGSRTMMYLSVQVTTLKVSLNLFYTREQGSCVTQRYVTSLLLGHLATWEERLYGNYSRSQTVGYMLLFGHPLTRRDTIT